MSVDLLEELPELEGMITVSLAGVMLGVSRQAVHRMVRTRRLEAWRIRSAGADRPLVVRESDVLAMRDARKDVQAVEMAG